MSIKKYKKKFFFPNFLSIVILIIFVLIELLYFDKIPNLSIKNVIDAFPNNILLFFENDKNDDAIIISDKNIVATNNEIIKDYTDELLFSPNYRLSTVSEAYFENTLFIGDSRMLGFSIYKKLPGATYYCYQSADAFTILDKEYEIEPYGMISLYNLLSLKIFDKIYISLGINNVAAGIENHRKHYKYLLDTIMIMQPKAIIYLLGNLHVTGELKSDLPYLTNENINIINSFISEFEDKNRVFYLDPNVVYDDEYGNMNSELSYDQAHIFIKHYDKYLDFLLTHAVVYN